MIYYSFVSKAKRQQIANEFPCETQKRPPTIPHLPERGVAVNGHTSSNSLQPVAICCGGKSCLSAKLDIPPPLRLATNWASGVAIASGDQLISQIANNT